MLRILFSLFFCIIYSNKLLAQSKRIVGKITDGNKQAIAFAMIEDTSKQEIEFSDEQGNFILILHSNETKIKISCAGYQDTVLSAIPTKDTLFIQLNRMVTSLEGVTVTQSKIKWKTATLGHRQQYYGNNYLGPGFESGVLLLPPKGRSNGYLEKLYFYISDLGIPDSKFRIHVYNTKMSGNYRIPDADITDSNLIVQANSNGGYWLTIDVSELYIPVLEDGIIVSMEWLSSEYGNNDSIIHNYRIVGNKYYKYTNNKLVKRKLTKRKRKQFENSNNNSFGYKGQVLGASKNKYSEVTYSRNLRTGKEWGLYIKPIIPMIYASYKYY